MVIRSSARLHQSSARNSVNCRSSCQDSKEMSIVFARRCQRGRLPAARRHLQPQCRRADHTGRSAPRPVTLPKKKSSYPALPGGSGALAIGLCAVAGLPLAAEDKHQVTPAVRGSLSGRRAFAITRKTRLGTERLRCESFRLTVCVVRKHSCPSMKEIRVSPQNICIFSGPRDTSTEKCLL